MTAATTPPQIIVGNNIDCRQWAKLPNGAWTVVIPIAGFTVLPWIEKTNLSLYLTIDRHNWSRGGHYIALWAIIDAKCRNLA